MKLLREQYGLNMKQYSANPTGETALNNGENLEGKIVEFVAKEVHPNSVLGYNFGQANTSILCRPEILMLKKETYSL